MSTWRRRLSASAAAALSITGLGVATATVAHAATCTTYYISTSGSDSNSGCSSSAPWASIAKVNDTTFAAGAGILFEDGDSWTGELHPLGNGAGGDHIVISNYGSGADPIIAGGGAAAAVYLDDQSFWTIENLDITNTASAAAVRSGILVENDTDGLLKGISILDNDVHNVLGYWTSTADDQPSTSAGIAFNLNDAYTTNGWDEVTIEGNTLNDDDAAGIYLGSLAGTGHDIYTGEVTILNNSLTDIGGSDVVCIYCDDAVVEYNVATDNGARYSGAGFWTAISTGGYWQYNEISDQQRAASDGQAFDLDHATTDVTVQYNYTHDNPWGFFEFCCTGSNGSVDPVVRYNISQDDGADEAVFRLFGVNTSGTAQIYNNTVYVGSSTNSAITVDGPASDNLYLTNNIIDNLGSGGYATSADEIWNYNTFYGEHPSTEPTDAHKLTTNPDFDDPGGAGSGRSSASAYILESGSPDLGTGTLISNNGGLDYFGNTVSSTASPNRGAYQ